LTEERPQTVEELSHEDLQQGDEQHDESYAAADPLVHHEADAEEGMA
jgi:hypothetical protein